MHSALTHFHPLQTGSHRGQLCHEHGLGEVIEHMGQGLQVIRLHICGEQRQLQAGEGRDAGSGPLDKGEDRTARPGLGWPLTGASPVEALHQLGDVVGEEALAEHDAHVGVAALVQHVWGLSHEQEEAVSCGGAQLHVAQQTQQLRGKEP